MHSLDNLTAYYSRSTSYDRKIIACDYIRYNRNDFFFIYIALIERRCSRGIKISVVLNVFA